MRTLQQLDQLRDEAVALRLAGKLAYHGCLRIEVRRSGPLYRKIAGWASAVMDA